MTRRAGDHGPDKLHLPYRDSHRASRHDEAHAIAPPTPVPGKATLSTSPVAGGPIESAPRSSDAPYSFEPGIAIVRSAWLRGTARTDATSVEPARAFELLFAARAAGCLPGISDDQLAVLARTPIELSSDQLAPVIRLPLPGATAVPAWKPDVDDLAPRLGLGAVAVRADAGSRAITEAEAARGVAVNGVVHLHPERIRPGTAEGRRVLAHELVHLAQAELSSEHDAGRAAAEHEANELADQLIAGASVRPRCAIDLSRAAADGGADRAGSDVKLVTGFGDEIAIGKFARVGWRVQFQAPYADPSAKPAPQTKLGVGIQEAKLERVSGEWKAKMSTALGKYVESFDLEELPLDLDQYVKLSLKQEVKLLEADISTSGISVDALRVAYKGEADVSAVLDLPPGTCKLQVKFEIRIPSRIVKDLLRVADAGDDVAKAAKVDRQFAAAQRELADADRMLAQKTLPDRIDRKVLQAHRAETAAKVGRLEKLRKTASVARERGLKTLKEVGTKLAKSPAGRLAARTFKFALRKILPIYNLISTVQDLYDLAEALWNADWSSLFSGDNDGGGGGQLGGEADDDGAEGGIGGDGGADGVTGTEPDPEMTAQDFEPPPHNAAVAAVLDGLVVSGGASQQLDEEAEALIDSVVPADLTPSEIAQVVAYATGATNGGEPVDLVTALIEAMEYVRPFGEKRAAADPAAGKPTASDPGPRQRAPRPRATRAPTRHRRNRHRRAGKSAEPVVIDLVPILRRQITFDPATQQVTVPAQLLINELQVDFELVTRVVWQNAVDQVSVVVRVHVRENPANLYIAVGGVGKEAPQGTAHVLTFDLPATATDAHSADR